jgi:hypothetical protein
VFLSSRILEMPFKSKFALPVTMGWGSHLEL